jgi:hypothetical protein
MMNGRQEHMNNSSMGKFTLAVTNLISGEGNGTGSNQILDLKQIKKIEPKRPEKNSTKANKNFPANNDYVKIDNLNAKTAEIMKASPSVGNHYHNQSFTGAGNPNPRALINVNINNSNRVEKNEVSNYEKSLFKGNNYGNNTHMNVNANVTNTNMNSASNNPYYQNQKRNHLQMTNYYSGTTGTGAEISNLGTNANTNKVGNMNNSHFNSNSIHSNINNNNSHLHTPMNSMNLNDMYRSKKIKYN